MARRRRAGAGLRDGLAAWTRWIAICATPPFGPRLPQPIRRADVDRLETAFILPIFERQAAPKRAELSGRRATSRPARRGRAVSDGRGHDPRYGRLRRTPRRRRHS